jgi:hypothetical protein
VNPQRSDKQDINQRIKAVRLFRDFLGEVGARALENDHFSVTTIFGPLKVAYQPSPTGDWISARFTDDANAPEGMTAFMGKGMMTIPHLNPYSKKWNFMGTDGFDSVRWFMDCTRAILPK